MSYNPTTGLVYIPAQEVPTILGLEDKWKYRPGSWNTGLDFALITEFPRSLASGHLLAWDPIRQKEVWRAQYKTPWNGGTLTTAGNLVFQGTADGRFIAYRATDGKPLWESPAGTGIVAAPITYSLDGDQYVSVMAGWGGVFALYGGDAAKAAGVRSVGRMLTFKLGGTAQLPAPPPLQENPLIATSAPNVSAQRITLGQTLFARNCLVCHGAGAVGGGVLPDLRYMHAEAEQNFEAIVHGAYRGRGMPSFDYLSADDVQAILDYIRKRAAETASAKP
jgi:quinohemoprotein ethanol dehydrogenase